MFLRFSHHVGKEICDATEEGEPHEKAEIKCFQERNRLQLDLSDLPLYLYLDLLHCLLLNQWFLALWFLFLLCLTVWIVRLFVSSCCLGLVVVVLRRKSSKQARAAAIAAD